ncbi:hypothetical protein D3C81_2125380 [compost metagenome]
MQAGALGQVLQAVRQDGQVETASGLLRRKGAGGHLHHLALRVCSGKGLERRERAVADQQQALRRIAFEQGGEGLLGRAG